MWRYVVVLVVAVGLAAGVTVPKLHKMAQIKGWRPGATVTTRVVTDKGVDTGRRGFKHYWVSWANHGAPTRADRAELGPEDWASTRVGDDVEVVRVPGDDSAYLKNGVFVEPGNFVFDYVLLAGEIVTALVMAVVVLFRTLRGRAPELTPDFVREKLTSALRVIDESLLGHRKELEGLEEKAGNEPSPELKAEYLKQADEKRKALEEIVRLRQSIENQLNNLQHP